ncbi:hypothetical protein D3C85_1079010 [compost metagenome]
MVDQLRVGRIPDLSFRRLFHAEVGKDSFRSTADWSGAVRALPAAEYAGQWRLDHQVHHLLCCWVLCLPGVPRSAGLQTLANHCNGDCPADLADVLDDQHSVLLRSGLPVPGNRDDCEPVPGWADLGLLQPCIGLSGKNQLQFVHVPHHGAVC